MAYDLEPFAVRLTPSHRNPDTITLLGDLRYSPDIDLILKDAARNIHAAPCNRWTIRADDIRIVPGGERIWIDFVHEYLGGYELIYEPSQLTLILQYGDDYRHQRSVFKEY
jgi:hypothetical protein